ncbi:MAG TPA: ABC transporter ATP-binding protein [Gemmatimonadales bacterium]
MISADRLSRSFEGRPAVESLSFELPAGSLLALLGPNGAGKTTTIRMLLGLIRPTAGSARVAGISLSGDEQARRQLRAACGFLTEAPGFYERRSALENLRFFGRLYAAGPELEGRIERYLRELDLWEHRTKPVGAFSKGMKQRLAIIRALFHEPQVLFLDEPTAGLDPEAALEVRELIAQLKTQGRTILVCTHNLAEAERLADWVGIINRRLLVFERLSTLQQSLGAAISVRIRLAQSALLWDETVRRLEGPSDLKIADHHIEFRTDQADVVVPRVVTALAQAGAAVVEVVPQRATLEAVYLACMRQGLE